MKKELPDRISVQNTLYLRSVASVDAEDFLKILQENQSHFTNFEFQSPTFSELAEVQAAINSLKEYQENRCGVSYGFWDQTQLIGLITINKIDWIEESADIGIWLVENATGKGLAFKSLKAIIEVCWNILNLKTLTAHTALSNIKCQCLLEKLSFTKTQLLKNHIKVRGQNVDEYQYQLAKPQ